jgi:hypothetical protein
MIKNIIAFIFSIVLLFSMVSCSEQKTRLISKNGEFQLELNKDGSLSSIFDKSGGKDYLDKNEKAYLTSIRIDGNFEFPVSMEQNKGLIILTYPSGTKAEIKYTSKETHIILELT